MGYIMRWILKVEDRDEFIIKKRKVSRHMPVNRMIEEAGHYHYDFIDMGDFLYMYVFKPEEYNTRKSAVMVGRFEKNEESISMTDMTVDDMKNLSLLYKKFFYNEPLN